jgi:tetratricopeptide (TPR) repeat protein
MQKQREFRTRTKGQVPERKPPGRIGNAASDTKSSARVVFAALSAAMLVAVLVVYWPVLNHDFVKYDDDKYITDNARVTGGLTRDSVIEAFTKPHFFMWHPLTTLSHTLDCELFGLAPAGHHLVSLLFHAVNTLLLFWLLRKLTGALWPSAFITAVFALHPLQLESVAWISERKNVLMAFFWILTMAAYARYAKRPNVFRFVLVTVLFALCTMSKPAVVTVPFVLLLLDYWPLRRFELTWRKPLAATEPESGQQPSTAEPTCANDRTTALWRLFAEKVPLFLLVAFLGTVTYLAQKGGGVVSGLEKLRLSSRIANAVISYVTYIEKLIWPSGLAVFHPHPAGEHSQLGAAVCTLLLVFVTVFSILQVRRRKYVAVGWLWYVGTLVPVIGLVQAGAQARANRYMYMTMIGLLIVIAWSVKDTLARWPRLKPVVAMGAVAVLTALGICTRVQLGYWKNSETLFRHALGVTRNNFVMHNNYANLLTDKGLPEEAIKHFESSLRLRPKSAEIHNNLGNALGDLGRIDDAIEHYRKAMRLEEDFAVAHYNLAGALVKKGDHQEAIAEYREAISSKPKYVEAWNNLGLTLAGQGQFEQAIECYRKALELRPNFILAHGRLALALARLDNTDEALEHCRIVLKARPDDVEMHCNVAVLLEKQGQIEQAIERYRQALEIDPDYPRARQRLEAALAKQKTQP